MDPKQDLKPEHKEVYDRIMNTPVAPRRDAASPPFQPDVTSQATTTPLPNIPPQAVTDTSKGFVFSDKKSGHSGGKGLSPFVLLVGGLVFAAIYAAVWLKVLGFF